MEKLPIDWASVDWVNVAILAAFVFVAGLVGNLLAAGNRLFGSFFTAVLFAVLFVLWTYWLRDVVAANLVKPA